MKRFGKTSSLIVVIAALTSGCGGGGESKPATSTWSPTLVPSVSTPATITPGSTPPATTTPSPSDPAVTLVDASFEDAPPLSGWTLIQGGADTRSYAATFSSWPAGVGDRYLHSQGEPSPSCVSTGVSNYATVLGQRVSLVPGHTYWLSGWARGGGFLILRPGAGSGVPDPCFADREVLVSFGSASFAAFRVSFQAPFNLPAPQWLCLYLNQDTLLDQVALTPAH